MLLLLHLLFMAELTDEECRFKRSKRPRCRLHLPSMLCNVDQNISLKPDPHLEVFVDQHHRSFVSMSSKHKVIADREDDNRSINQTAPVHRCELNRRSQREESKDVDQ